MVANLVTDSVFCLSSPRSFSSISTGSGPVYIVLDSFKVEPLALFEDAKNEEAEDSVEAKESDDDLGVRPGRCCDVIYGPRPLGVLRGVGEYARLPGWEEEGDDD